MEHKRGNLTTTGFGKVLFGRAVKKMKMKSLYICPSREREREREKHGNEVDYSKRLTKVLNPSEILDQSQFHVVLCLERLM